MSTINPDLAATLKMLADNAQTAIERAKDDQHRAAIIDRLARLSDDEFIGLATTIIDRATAAFRTDAIDDILIAELAMIGWTVALESLTNRMEDQHGDAA